MRDIAKRMQKAGFVGPDYYEKPIDRETVIAATILKKPIIWNNSNISIILAIAVCRKDYPIFQNIFSFLTSICMDATSMEHLYKAKDYNDFMRILMGLYEKE
jgi:mannitol/fructose-specific phosphotransferase system IIA component